ncbi:alpha/beta fold hydrolase [Halopseudomonas pachastrellae]|nr:alpha/beta fold hydrolase [Halopseudomonas pachastrellae]
MYSVDDIQLEHRLIDGVNTRIASVGEGPVALLIHGWPECWYSWRPQMVALANAGFRAVAPDMPGLARNRRPAPDWGLQRQTYRRFYAGVGGAYQQGQTVLLIGHDWGAINCWQFVQLHPELVERLVIMSVPLRPVADVPPIEFLRGYFADNFFYQVYFQEPVVWRRQSLMQTPRGSCAHSTAHRTRRVIRPCWVRRYLRVAVGSGA